MVTTSATRPPEPTKQCSMCKIIKPVSEYAPDRGKAHGVNHRCRPCDAKRSRERYAAGKRRSTAAEAALQQRVTERYAVARAAAVAIYGGACEWCGTDESLELDHVNDDGDEHRDTEGHVQYMVRIAELGARLPDRELRLLCAPCHRGPGWRERRATCTPASRGLTDHVAAATRLADVERVCARGGCCAVLRRRANEKANHWLRRRYCGRECVNLTAAWARRTKAAASRRQGVVLTVADSG